MTKGIRKACANCIKARLACDEGRPCQRCIVHQCDCVPVARKPRVKKPRLEDLPLLMDKTEPGGLAWIQSDPSTFLAESNKEKESVGYVFSPPTSLSPSTSPTISRPPPPPFVNAPIIIIPPVQNLPLIPLPIPLAQEEEYVPPPSLQEYVPLPPPQEYAPPPPPPSLSPSFVPTLPQYSPQPPPLSSFTPPVQSPPNGENVMSPCNILSLLFDDKAATLFPEWSDMTQANFTNDCADACCKKSAVVAPAPLPQPKNAIPLFPAPIGVFDKTKFNLLDTNVAMANLLGFNTVAELATVVMTIDDLIDPAAAHIAKNANSYFVPSMPYDRLGVLRLPNNRSKTVEFRVDLTELLVILTVKSVFDDCFSAVPEVPIPVQYDGLQAAEFLAPID